MLACPPPNLAQLASNLEAIPGAAAWVTCALLGSALLWWCSRRLLRGAPVHVGAMARFSAFSFLLKLALLAVFMTSSEYAPKQAAETGLNLWLSARMDGPAELLADPTFLLPALAAAPLYEAFGPEPAFAAILNCVAVGVGALVLTGAIGAFAGRRAAWATLVWLLWNPASVYWGLHGLRDPFIFMAMCFTASGLVRLAAPAGQGGGVARGLGEMTLSAALLALLRPEMLVAPIGCIAAAAALLPNARRMRGWAVAALLVAAVAMPLILSDQLGLDSLEQDSIEMVAHARLARSQNAAAGGAGESSFFGSDDEFLAQDFGDRLSTQFIGMIACPYPMWPRNAADWGVALQSVVWIMGMALPFLVRARTRADVETRRLARVAAVCALAGLALFAPLTVNAGNAFRLRFSYLPVVSIALVLAAVPATRRRVLLELPAHAARATRPAPDPA